MERTGPLKNLTIAQRGSIIHLDIAGRSVREIAEQLGCSEKTVRRWLDRHNDTGNVLRQPGTGRPTKINHVIGRRITEHIRRQPITTSENIISK